MHESALRARSCSFAFQLGGKLERCRSVCSECPQPVARVSLTSSGGARCTSPGRRCSAPQGVQHPGLGVRTSLPTLAKRAVKLSQSSSRPRGGVGRVGLGGVVERGRVNGSDPIADSPKVEISMTPIPLASKVAPATPSEVSGGSSSRRSCPVPCCAPALSRS